MSEKNLNKSGFIGRYRANYKSTYDYILSIAGRKKEYSANVN